MNASFHSHVHEAAAVCRHISGLAGGEAAGFRGVELRDAGLRGGAVLLLGLVGLVTLGLLILLSLILLLRGRGA